MKSWSQQERQRFLVGLGDLREVKEHKLSSDTTQKEICGVPRYLHRRRALHMGGSPV
jgi:hypothetical protein